MLRILVLITVLLIPMVGSVVVTSAQEATPEAAGGSLLEQYGFPEVRITIAEDGIQVPDQVESGQLLLTVENTLDFPAGFSIIRLPEGTTLEEALAAFGPPPGEEAGMATPEAAAAAEGDATPMAGPEEEIPEWFFTATWAGGAFAPPSGRAQVVITLTPGEWVLLSDPESGLAPVTLMVGEATGTPAATGEVATEAMVEMDDFQIRLPQQIQAGPQVWHVTNVGDQPHEMFIARTPQLLTLDQIEQLLELPEDAPPPPGIPDPAEFEDVGGVAPISQDQAVLVELDLEPGNYVAVCFMPDRETGAPHAMKGMYVVFQIGTAGEEVAPPASPVPQEDDHS